jgi:hypothetical protein
MHFMPELRKSITNIEIQSMTRRKRFPFMAELRNNLQYTNRDKKERKEQLESYFRGERIKLMVVVVCLW